MAKIQIKKGEKFNKLTFLELTDNRRSNAVCALFECECGNIKEMTRHLVVRGVSKTCGCGGPEATRKRNFARRSPTPTLYHTSPVLGVRTGMKSRCYNPNNADYHNYGGRGITVCDEWRKSLLIFHTWALENGYKKGLQLDRIDTNGNYEPSNCRFVTCQVNQNNKRNNVKVEYKGEMVTVLYLSEISKVKTATLYLRLFKHGLSAEEAISIKKYDLRIKNKCKIST